MKILNEKGLIHFASSGAPADKEGYLHKKGELNKGFQKRWFVLKGNLLFYYEKKGDKEPIGVIIVEGCTIELAEDSDNFMFMIKFATSSTRTYCLSAHSQEVMESWMKALSCAGYEYVKLMVSELQIKLEEARSSADSSLIQAADRESLILGRMYDNDNNTTEKILPSTSSQKISSLTAQKHRINPFNDLENSGEVDPGDSLRPMTNISMAEIVTWSILEVKTFSEMHELIRQQIIEFSSQVS